MTSKQISSIAFFVALVAANPNGASAQFGGLFGGGPKVETIETDALAKMLREQREVEAKSRAASAVRYRHNW